MKNLKAFRTRFMPAIMALGLVAVSSAALTSCDNDDDDITPKKEYVEAFRLLYPTATNVSWEGKSGGYVVAEFKNESRQEVEVWFDDQVQWAMTKTDYEKDFSAVPNEVMNDIKSSQYSTWYMDDAEYVERRDGNFYVVEVEQQGSPDTDLVYRADGTFVKAVPGTIESISPLTVFE